MVAGKAWSREWSFTTEDVEPYPGKRAEAALERFNKFRKLAGLNPVSLDRALSRGCQAHAAYLALHYGKGKKEFSVHSENPDWEGYTKEGAAVARPSVPTFNAADGPAQLDRSVSAQEDYPI